MKIYELYELSVEHKDLSLDYFSIENIGNIFNSLENISERYSIEDDGEAETEAEGETEAEQQNKTSSSTVRRTGFAKVITNIVWFFQRAYTFFVELIRKFRIWLASKSIKRAINELNKKRTISKLDKKPDTRYTAILFNKDNEEGQQYRIDRNILFLLAYFHPDTYNAFTVNVYYGISRNFDKDMASFLTAPWEKRSEEMDKLIDNSLYYETMIKKYIASVCSKKEGTFEFEKKPGVSGSYYKNRKIFDSDNPIDGHNQYEFESSKVMSDIRKRIQEITTLGEDNSNTGYFITGDFIKELAKNLLDYLKKREKLSSTMCNELKKLRLSKIGDENYRNYVWRYKEYFGTIQKLIRAEMETGFLCVKALNKLVKRLFSQVSITDDNSLTL